jgi:uncharacterized protein YhbP (UPF0306 family)
MTESERAAVGAFLDGFHTLSLATQDANGPWAASLFFASDRFLNLYFVSGRGVRHVEDLLVNPRVALTIGADTSRWSGVRGMQISGVAAMVEHGDRDAVSELYLRKFDEMRQILSAPTNAGEAEIGYRFRASEFFRIRPLYIRLIDNAQGFSHKVEYVLEH